MIIGLNGRMKSGKDTTFHVIKEIYKDSPLNVRQVSYAQPIKESAAASLGIDLETLEYLKADENLCFTLQDNGDLFKFNIREFIQRFGTEGHRDIFGENFWVDMALPLDKDYSDALYVVTDMRFPNEVERVISLGGRTVRVMREVESAHSGHRTEQNIDHMIEHFLDNTGSMEDLQTNVIDMLNLFNRTKVKVA